MIMIEERYSQASDLDMTNEGDTIVVRMTADEWAVFEGTAFDLWRLLAVPRSIREITEKLSTSYRTDSETIARDTAEALADWERRGLVIRVPASV
jgi:hypothetical protein